MWKFHQIQISELITFYWNRAMLIHLSIICGHLPATRAELKKHSFWLHKVIANEAREQQSIKSRQAVFISREN